MTWEQGLIAIVTTLAWPAVVVIAAVVVKHDMKQHGGHFPCRGPGETPGQFTARAFGETRDM